MKIQDSPNRFYSEIGYPTPLHSGRQWKVMVRAAVYRVVFSYDNSNYPMPITRPLTFLCITTYEKGQEFMRECKRQGCRVILLTAEKLRDADWPRESLDKTFHLPEEILLADIVKAVTHLARGEKI